jgi:hypothetical protein
MNPTHRAFLDGLLARAAPPPTDPHRLFRERIIDRWDDIVVRVEGRLAMELRTLPDDVHRCLRALEDTRSLLGPLGIADHEPTHTRILAHALRLDTPLGATLKRCFARLVGANPPEKRWHVRAESTVGPRCRVDVDVHVPGAWRCFIEAKVRADERASQLDDYAKCLAASARPDEAATLVFLTVDRQLPRPALRLVRLTWGELAAAWLPLVLGTEPDAGWIRAWLTGIVTDVYEAADDGPFATWDTATRVRALDLFRPTERPEEGP